jgi:hypothetical protein
MRSQDDGDVVGLSGAACPQAGFTRAQQNVRRSEFMY